MKNEKHIGEPELKAKIVPDFENINEQKRFFSNFLSVSHDAFVFTFTFCDMHFEAIRKDKLKEKDEEGSYILTAPISAQIIVPALLMPEIIKACQENYDRYTKKAEKK